MQREHPLRPWRSSSPPSRARADPGSTRRAGRAGYARPYALLFIYPKKTQLRYLFANRPAVMGQVLGIVYRVIAAHLIKKTGFTHQTAWTGAVTLIQRFGSALNLNVHFHMLFLDGAYVDDPHKCLRFVRVKAPNHEELTALVGTIARRVGRKLERQGLLERDIAYGYLIAEAVDDDPMAQLQDHSITYRIAVGPDTGRKVFTVQTLPAYDKTNGDRVGKLSGFSLHAGVAAGADERDKLERLCRYISRPAVAEQRLSLTSSGQIRYRLKSPQGLWRFSQSHCLYRRPCGDQQDTRSSQ